MIMRKQHVNKILIEANDLVDRAHDLVEGLCNDLDDAEIYNEDLYAAVDDIRASLEHVQYNLVTIWNEDD
tara:strand:+ start:47 stop:256 length:210 start_codon:yes stop_codon:yes gene_type:complete